MTLLGECYKHIKASTQQSSQSQPTLSLNTAIKDWLEYYRGSSNYHAKSQQPKSSPI